MASPGFRASIVHGTSVERALRAFRPCAWITLMRSGRPIRTAAGVPDSARPGSGPERAPIQPSFRAFRPAPRCQPSPLHETRIAREIAPQSPNGRFDISSIGNVRRIPWSVAALSAGSLAPGTKAEMVGQSLCAANDNAVAKADSTRSGLRTASGPMCPPEIQTYPTHSLPARMLNPCVVLSPRRNR